MRVPRVNGVVRPDYVPPDSEELGDLLRAAEARCPRCSQCGGTGFIEWGDDDEETESGFCDQCAGRGFINDDPVLDETVVWVCDACGQNTYDGSWFLRGQNPFCWHCRMPYDGDQVQEPVPLRTVCPITGDKLG